MPNFRAIAAPITEILRSTEFNSLKARRKKVPWGVQQTAAMAKIVDLLTSPQVLAAPDWDRQFSLHTDPSTLAAGAVLTRENQGKEAPLAYGSHRWSRAEENGSANDREVLAVLWALNHFRPYLLFKQFILITDCATILLLFVSQQLFPKMLRWALRLAEFDLEHKWRKGMKHVEPDALSRLRRAGVRDPDIDPLSAVDQTSRRWVD